MSGAVSDLHYVVTFGAMLGAAFVISCSPNACGKKRLRRKRENEARPPCLP